MFPVELVVPPSHEVGRLEQERQCPAGNAQRHDGRAAEQGTVVLTMTYVNVSGKPKNILLYINRFQVDNMTIFGGLV